jgi:hypothetical protein
VTKYLFIAIFFLTLALAGLGKLYLWKVEELGALNVQYEHQRGETAKAIAQYEGAVALHEMQIEKYTLLNEERQKDEIRYQRDVARITGLLESTQAAALKEPERFGRIATYNFRRGLRQVCRSGGGSRDDCAIDIPKPAATDSGSSVQPDTQDNDGVAVEGG